jgi:hypothetical protein
VVLVGALQMFVMESDYNAMNQSDSLLFSSGNGRFVEEHPSSTRRLTSVQ